MNSNSIETIISKGAVFTGKIESKDSIRIDGHVSGEIKSEATIDLGESGVVDGNLTAKNIITAGKIKGALNAEEKIELRGTSKLDGDLVTVRLVIEDGAQFEGMCCMGSKSSAQKAVANLSAPEEDVPKKDNNLFGKKEK
jgi:cytoskeletal protein CcmA (bactofilin family)